METKKCTRCLKLLEVSAFSIHRTRGLQCWCKSCKRGYEIANREATNARHRRYNADGRLKAAQKAWRQANPKKCYASKKSWIAKNPEKQREMRRRWKAKRKAQDAAAQSAREAAKALRTPEWADKRAISCFYHVAERVTKCLGIRHEVDHIVPLRGEIVSGLHVHWNLRVIPGRLNWSKGNRLQEAA